MRTPVRSSRLQKAWRLTILMAFAASLLLVALPGLAVHEDDFDLQGHVTSSAAFDWDDFLEGEGGDTDGDVTTKAMPGAAVTAGFIASGASPDHYRGGPDRTTFTQGSKDTLDISDWTCTRSNNVGNKVDILNAYSVAQRNDDGDLIIYFGVEVREPEGNSNIGMWFLKDPDAGCEAPATGKAQTPFDGSHQDGDVLVVSAFTNGGTTANISVYEWVGSGAQGALQLKGDFQNVACDNASLPDDDVACAIANGATIATPWHSPDKSDQGATLPPNTFFEGGVNISEVLDTDGPQDECFTKFLANTRSSQSLTATIFDFTIDELNICGDLTIVKETDPEDANQNFTFEIEGPDHSAPADNFTLNADTNPSTTFSNVLAGTYTITETDIPDGWDLDAISCVGNNGIIGDVDLAAGSVTVDLAAEGSVTCTFTNKQRGSILIEKEYDVAPLDGQISEFTVFDNGTSVGLMDATIVDATTVLYCLDDLIVGDTYRVSETSTPDGFAPADDVNVTVDTPRTCDDRLADQDPVVDATIENLADNRNLTVQKLKLSHDDDGFVETALGLAGFTFTVYEGTDDTGDVIASSTTDGLGFTDFDDGILEVGETYTVCETGVPHPGYWTDSDCQTFTVELNEDVDLEFFNAPRADITIHFSDVTGFTSVTIVCVVGIDADGDPIEVSTELSGDGQLDLDALDLGDYDCTIKLRNGAVNGD